MSHRFQIRVFVLAAAAFALPAHLHAQGTSSRPSGEYLDAVAAKVNRTVITKSQVDKDLGAAARTLPPADYDANYRQRLMKLVFGAIEQDAVEKVGLQVPKRYILEQLEQQKEKKGAAEVSAGIREAGYKSEEEYIEALGRQASGQTYIAAQAGQFAAKAPQFRPDYWTEPTATEIRRYYRQHATDEFTQKNQAHLYAIFLPYSAFLDPSAPKGDLTTGKARVLDIAATIREELKRGTSFGDLARRYGRELKADEGGDLGWVEEKASYQRELVDFALKGPLKELSEPILYPTKETPRGIVVAWVSERVEQRVMPFAEAQSKIRDFLRNQSVDAARKKIIQKLLEDAYVSPADVKRDLLRTQER